MDSYRIWLAVGGWRCWVHPSRELPPQILPKRGSSLGSSLDPSLTTSARSDMRQAHLKGRMKRLQRERCSRHYRVTGSENSADLRFPPKLRLRKRTVGRSA